MGPKFSKEKSIPQIPVPVVAPKGLPPIALTMAGIFGCILLVVAFLAQLPYKNRSDGNWLPTKNNLNKRQFEIFALQYTVVWITAFCVVIVFQMYNSFSEWGYMILCLGLDLSFLLQPVFFPLPSERCLPITMRYSFKANVWLVIFSFVGSYWYTHYFYSVLGAQYTFSSHRLNDVPIALYFAAHFYFVTYHTLSNMLLRKVETRYRAGPERTLLFWAVVIAFSYFTAFMETLTISSFPDYSFRDRDMAYKLGSAFYGIYFLVSFPVFYRIDEAVSTARPLHSLFQTVMEAAGSSMIVLCLLDFCRLAVNIPLSISGVGYYLYKKK